MIFDLDNYSQYSLRSKNHRMKATFWGIFAQIRDVSGSDARDSLALDHIGVLTRALIILLGKRSSVLRHVFMGLVAGRNG